MATGVACRASSGFVTDGANDTYCLGALDTGSGVYPITRAGLTFGWSSSQTDPRDREAGVDVRLAGTIFNGSLTSVDFQMDVTAGNNDIKVGACDVDNTQTVQIRIYDNTVLRATAGPSAVAGVGTTSSDVMASDGTVYTTQALWSAAAPITYSISTGTLIVRVGDGASANTGYLAYVQAVASGGAPPSTALDHDGLLFQYTQTSRRITI